MCATNLNKIRCKKRSQKTSLLLYADSLVSSEYFRKDLHQQIFMTTNQPQNPKSPSLLDNEATGGANSGKGLTFQDHVLLSLLPKWLSMEGFDAYIKEGLADMEAKFFVPGPQGYVKEFVETKDHNVAPAEFWKEIDRFQEMTGAGSRVYRWFRFICTSLSAELQPLKNGLRRIREPYDFYSDDQAVSEASYKDYEARVIKLGRTAYDAKFLFEQVVIDDEYSGGVNSGSGLFQSALAENLPAFEVLQGRTLGQIYDHLGTLVQQKINVTVTRTQIEAALMKPVPDQDKNLIFTQPVHVHVRGKEGPDKERAIVLEAAKFFGEERLSLPSDEWENGLMIPLRQTRQWIICSRPKRSILLTGEKRFSTSVAIGSVFSSVEGFTIKEELKDGIWATNSYNTANTPAYNLEVSLPTSTGDHLIVVIDIVRLIEPSVGRALSTLGLAGQPCLHLHGEQPLLSAEQADFLIKVIKNKITDSLQSTGATRIDLFLAVPSFLALLFGHRLNSLAPVQCYEWAGGDSYVLTCLV